MVLRGRSGYLGLKQAWVTRDSSDADMAEIVDLLGSLPALAAVWVVPAGPTTRDL